MSCETGRWVRKGTLVVVCCVCVAEGLVAAPPNAVRSDGYCPLHLEALRAELRARAVAAHGGGS